MSVARLSLEVCELGSAGAVLSSSPNDLVIECLHETILLSLVGYVVEIHQ